MYTSPATKTTAHVMISGTVVKNQNSKIGVIENISGCGCWTSNAQEVEGSSLKKKCLIFLPALTISIALIIIGIICLNNINPIYSISNRISYLSVALGSLIFIPSFAFFCKDFWNKEFVFKEKRDEQIYRKSITFLPCISIRSSWTSS